MAEYLLFIIVRANTEHEALTQSKEIITKLEGTDVPLDSLETFNTNLWMRSNTINECITPLRLPMDDDGVNTLKLKQLDAHGHEDALEEYREKFALPLTDDESYARITDGIERGTAVIVNATNENISYIQSKKDITNLNSSNNEELWVSKWSVRFDP